MVCGMGEVGQDLQHQLLVGIGQDRSAQTGPDGKKDAEALGRM